MAQQDQELLTRLSKASTLSRLRPKCLDDLRAVCGIGEKKLADLGARLLERIAEHARKADAP